MVSIMNIKDLLLSQLPDQELVNNITSKPNITKYLTNEDLKQYLLLPEHHYAFVWLVETLSIENLDIFFDDYLTKLLLEQSNSNSYLFEKKMRSLLSLNNGRASIALKNIPLLKKIITRYPTILTYLDYTNPASTQIFFNFLLTNPKYLGCIGYLNPESELTLFQKQTNIDSLINANPYYNVFYRSSAPVINLFLQEKALGTLLYAYSLPELSNLFQKDIYLPNYLITSPQLQNIYLKENDINKFILSINLLLPNNSYFYDLLLAKKKDQIRESIRHVKENGLTSSINNCLITIKKSNTSPATFFGFNSPITDIFNQYHDKDLLIKLQNYCKKDLFSKLLVYFFEDVSFNAYYNINEMVNYLRHHETNIPKERKEIYYLLSDYNRLTANDIKKIFFLCLSANINSSNFYDDYRICLDLSNADIITKSINLTEEKDLSNKALSSKYNIPIYELTGQDFQCLISASRIARTGHTPKSFWHFNEPDLKTISMSLINQNHFLNFASNLDNVVFGFSNLSNLAIIHKYPEDSFTIQDYSSLNINKLLDSKELLSQTDYYNEILVQNKNVLPSYVIAYDEIKNNDILASKSLNIPLLLIHTKKYHLIASTTELSEEKYVNITDYDNLSNLNYKKG